MIKSDIESIRKIFAEELEARSRIDIKVHAEHHQFIAEWIEERRVKRDRFEKISQQVLGWGIIGFIGYIGTLAAKKISVFF